MITEQEQVTIGKPSPAPWTREMGIRTKHDNSAPIIGANGRPVAYAADFNRWDRGPEVEANAKLIAAVHELWEVAKRCAAMKAGVTNDELRATIALADKAIDKLEFGL